MGGHGVGWGAPVQGGVGCPGTYVPLGAPNGGARGRYIKWGVGGGETPFGTFNGWYFKWGGRPPPPHSRAPT